MIPIKGLVASGLHTWNNCQVIPAALNSMKCNAMVMTKAGEYLKYIGPNGVKLCKKHAGGRVEDV